MASLPFQTICEMIKTIKEMLLDWLGEVSTTRMPLPPCYTYEVQVDGRIIQIQSMSRSRLYVHYKARRKYPAAAHVRVIKQVKSYD